MNITMTGASGFIGRHLLRRLLKDGHRVTVLGRSRSRELPGNVHFFEWNATEGEPPPQSLEQTDAVIHLAGEPVGQRWNDEVRRKIRESRTKGTRHLVHSLSTVSRRPEVLVSASATGYYGDRGEETLTESSAPGDDFLAEVCEEWEGEANLADALGMRVVTIRTGLVLGRDGGALKRMLLPFKLGVGAKLGSGRQWMPWIHIDDLVEQYSFAVGSRSVRGPMNGTAPNPVRNAEFTQELASVLKKPALLSAPKFGLKL
ncbi:MAG: TIGR01777 family oxidoreductase, partial [Bryobacteraceae bacterium]